ncbi:hypothetical protein AOCH_001322 [Aspergillus ochraceoroseus]|uniref:Fungal-type protein kinase domain-containing protein n=1 Tax=Aspergillus ochraceoroseus TaxID=138278 RepID=A0A0F8UIP4_9EURO|nr:hypothetical protein AOCH_001322 [Aspergillus ochraceoroseus]
MTMRVPGPRVSPTIRRKRKETLTWHPGAGHIYADGGAEQELRDLSLDLILALQALPASRALPPVNSRSRNLFGDLSRLSTNVNADEVDIEQLLPLLDAILKEESDEVVWNKVYGAVTESTPPPRLLSVLDQTPFSHPTSSFVNSSEHRNYVDAVLKEELGSIFIGVPHFHDAFFGNIIGLEEEGRGLFRKLKEGDNPLYKDDAGWCDWPINPQEKEVLKWLSEKFKLLQTFALEGASARVEERAILTRPSKPLRGSAAKRKVDIAIIRGSQILDEQDSHWSHVLVPGELKSNPDLDTSSKTWRDLGRYAKEVFMAQDTRRFVLGFTLCGSVMRLWEFDRLGAIASISFDINRDGMKFILAMLGFMRMNDEQLGFDPTISTATNGKRYMEISRNGRQERLVLDRLMKPSSCVVGRATICWKAHLEDRPEITVVVKDSWQYPEREEEGEMLREISEKNVVNIATYFFHQTVEVNGKVDDVRINIRNGLDVTKASNFRDVHLHRARKDLHKAPLHVSSSNRKRSSSQVDNPLPRTKRPCSVSSSIGDDISSRNRIHRRVFISDYGKPIYRASSRLALLVALEHCLIGYESLHTTTGILQGDISTGNLMICESESESSWPAFLIDLDLAFQESREHASGARGKTGTRAFMAIGLLLGEKHSFWHDVESFFWVLFWICIHYNGPNADVGPTDFDCWNYDDDQKLANSKKGIVDDEADFEQVANMTVRNIQPGIWPDLYMFLDDRLPPNAVLIEYIPNLQPIDLSNFSEKRLAKLREILDDIHSAKVLHGDPKPRNMMVSLGGAREEKWIEEEVEKVDYFVDALAQDFEEGRLNRTIPYYYEWYK